MIKERKQYKEWKGQEEEGEHFIQSLTTNSKGRKRAWVSVWASKRVCEHTWVGVSVCVCVCAATHTIRNWRLQRMTHLSSCQVLTGKDVTNFLHII
jgi:hypothetical protein